MVKVLQISKYMFPYIGGTEQVARDLARALSSYEDKIEQKIICFNDNKKNVVDLVDNVEVTRCGTLLKVASQPISFSYPYKLFQIIKDFKPDVVVLHYPNPYVTSILLPILPKKVKLIVYWHLDIVKQKVLGKLFVNQNKKLISRADVLIATSPNYVDGSPYLNSAREKCIVIPNCIDECRMIVNEEIKSIARKIREENEGKTICVAVGRHTEYKGFKYLINASKYLDKNFQIFMIGKGELTEKLKEEAKEDSKIHFLGAVPEKELKAYLYAMDIFCFPSITKNEAFGLALVEGMYFGKPAVTFSIPGSGVNYVCLNGENGIEVQNKNVEAYAEAMRELASNPEMRQYMGAAGKRRVEENFLYSQFKESILKVINDM